MVKNLRILVDLDEVLIDFVGGAAERHGSTRAALERLWEPGRWDMRYPLSRALGRADVMSEEEFWEKLSGADFWLNLQSHPWMNEILRAVEAVTKDWRIVTSPSWCPSSYDGKTRWLKKHFGGQFDKFAVYRYKEDFAGPNVLLLDDFDRNLDKFRKAGGVGVSFPRLWNAAHEHAADPVRYVKRILETYR